MLAFESQQIVPITSLRDLDPYMQIKTKGKAFPIPGDEFHFVQLDLSNVIIKNPATTFFLQIHKNTMVDEGFFVGDVLIVDRKMEPKTKCLAVVYLEGEFIFCRLEMGDWGIRLHFANTELSTIEVEHGMEFQIWGIVRDFLHMDGKMLE